MMRILITGYNGFVGTNLLRELSGYDIIGIDINKGNMVSEHYYWHTFKDCSDIHCIIHLAGKAHDVDCSSEYQEYFDVNLGLTQRIFDFFTGSSASKFIYFSSVKAVADTFNNKILTEDHIPDPQTPYGKSKLAAEKYIIDRGLTPNKKVIILRPCMIHGPGNKGNLNILYRFIEKGIPYPLGSFENYRSFLSIWNLSYILTELIEKPVPSGIYNLADDEPISSLKIVELIASSLNKKPRVWKLPRSIVGFVAKTGDILKLPLNNDRLTKLTETYIVSNSKIKSWLGIDKLPLTTIDGLVRTLESFRK